MHLGELRLSDHYMKPMAVRTPFNTYFIVMWDGANFFTPNDGQPFNHILIEMVLPLDKEYKNKHVIESSGPFFNPSLNTQQQQPPKKTTVSFDEPF